MTYDELIAALNERGFKLEEKDLKETDDWSLHTKQLSYVEGVKGEGISFFQYEGTTDAITALRKAEERYWDLSLYERFHTEMPKLEDFADEDTDNAVIIFLIPDPELSTADITYLTTNRKRNLWTDYYATTYSGWERYNLKDMTKEQLFAQFDRQERLYKAINGLHENENMKGIINQISDIRKDIREKKNTVETLQTKLADWYKRVYQIEKDS